MALSIPKWNTFIIPIILTANIERCLETLYKYTEKNSFYVYIIDQTVGGLDATSLRNRYENLMVIRTPKTDLHYTGNLGFAQGTNLGISLVQTPYFTMCNDDVEFLNKDWWQGVLDTFDQVEKATPESPAVMVCPASVRLADWSVGRPDGDNFDILPYKEQYSEEEYYQLVHDEHYINEHLTLMPDAVIDGVTMYACVCNTRRFLEVGMLDERYFPGGGEDYDYSCLARMKGYRSVATTKSWVWHHWSSSFRAMRDELEEAKSLKMPQLHWNHNHEKWGDNFDIWGVKCSQCGQRMSTTDGQTAHCDQHPDETYDMPESTIMPL